MFFFKDFVKILNTDKMYRETKAAIANETRNKMENPPESEQEDMIRPLFSSKQNTANKKAWMPIQHYVKVKNNCFVIDNAVSSKYTFPSCQGQTSLLPNLGLSGSVAVFFYIFCFMFRCIDCQLKLFTPFLYKK